MDSLNILIVSGGNRTESFTTKLVHALMGMAPNGVTFSVADTTSLPLFNQDLEKAMPGGAIALKAAIRAADGIIFVTPEHNRSIPAVLKNAIDWASRPYGDNAWAEKPAFIIGNTPGGVGAAQAQAHLRQIIAYLDMRLLGQPEMYLSHINTLLGEDGTISAADTREFVSKGLETFANFARSEH